MANPNQSASEKALDDILEQLRIIRSDCLRIESRVYAIEKYLKLVEDNAEIPH